MKGERTKRRAKFGLNGLVAGQVVGCAKVLVETASEVNGGARQVTASLASEESMTLQPSIRALMPILRR
jgi:hypothetical protein